MVIEVQADSSDKQRASLFISYSRRDKDFVRRLTEVLKKRDRRIWVDLENIAPTAEWLAEVYSGIEGANAFVFVISPDSVNSEDCLRELAHAVEHNKKLIPIVCQEVDDKAVPEPLGSYNWIFFRRDDDFEQACQDLVDAVDTDLDWVREHTYLLTRAIEWDDNDKDNSRLLRGSNLREAEEWQVRAADKQPKLTTLQTEYLLAGRRDATRRQRVRFILVTFALIMALVLVSIALWQRNMAIRQANIALGRQLTAQAQLSAEQEPPPLQRSVLLALEARKQSPVRSFEGDQIIRNALTLLPHPVTRLSHEDRVTTIAFSPDGKYLATASDDKTVRVWDALSGDEVARMTHDASVYDVVFSPDGKYLAISSGDATRMWLWRRPEDLSAEACAHLTRNFTEEEWKLYLDGEPYRRTCPNLPKPEPATVDHDASRSENTATTEEASSKTLSPDPAFDRLLPTLQEMTTAPIMLPATLPPELKHVAIAPDTSDDTIPYNNGSPWTTHGDKYTILFLAPEAPNNLVQDYVHAYTIGTLTAEPTRTPLTDFSRLGVTVTQLDNVTLPDGTVAQLTRLEPPEGANYGTAIMGVFEQGNERYTLRIEFIDTPDGDLTRQTLSTMVKVPRS